MQANQLYRVVFVNDGKTYEVYATSVSQSELYGFVTIANLVFNEKTSVVVDPSEEKLKAEFEGVSQTNIPIHSVIRIDQVAKQGSAKISQSQGQVVTAFPIPDPGSKTK